MLNYKTSYKCHACGTPSYRRVITQDSSGAWRPTGAYQCSGCLHVFENLQDWWQPARQPEPKASTLLPA